MQGQRPGGNPPFARKIFASDRAYACEIILRVYAKRTRKIAFNTYALLVNIATGGQIPWQRPVFYHFLGSKNFPVRSLWGALCPLPYHLQNKVIKIWYTLLFFYFAKLFFVWKYSGQNFISFVFLYFAMLCAMFQNIVAKILYPLFFSILLCYALRIHFKTWRSSFFLCFSLLCFGAMFWNIAKMSTPKSCGVSRHVLMSVSLVPPPAL